VDSEATVTAGSRGSGAIAAGVAEAAVATSGLATTGASGFTVPVMAMTGGVPAGCGAEASLGCAGATSGANSGAGAGATSGVNSGADSGVTTGAATGAACGVGAAVCRQLFGICAWQCRVVFVPPHSDSYRQGPQAFVGAVALQVPVTAPWAVATPAVRSKRAERRSRGR
jgi:hypothetical protein